MKEDVLAPEVFGCLQQAMSTDLRGLVELCREYLADARRTVDQLQKELVANDTEQMRMHAHYLKGSSQVLGARGVAQCCMALEDATRYGDFRHLDELIRSTVVAVNAAEMEMEARIGTSLNRAGDPAA